MSPRFFLHKLLALRIPRGWCLDEDLWVMGVNLMEPNPVIARRSDTPSRPALVPPGMGHQRLL
jgi:hypothetical protein